MRSLTEKLRDTLLAEVEVMDLESEGQVPAERTLEVAVLHREVHEAIERLERSCKRIAREAAEKSENPLV